MYAHLVELNKNEILRHDLVVRLRTIVILYTDHTFIFFHREDILKIYLFNRTNVKVDN